MDAPKPPPRGNPLPQLFLAILLAGVYLNTLAPGLTWAHDGADGGDLITAAATGGVAHPTGYPLYLLLARLFQSIPAGPLAWRTNLMSAFFAVTAALLVFSIVQRETSSAGRGTGWMAGLAAGLAAGLMPLLWSQAIVTEVHALQAFFVALVFLLAALLPEGRLAPLRDSFLGLVMGLGMGNHVTLLLLVPVVILAGSFRPKEGEQGNRFAWGPFIRQVFFFLIGCSVYLLVPLWAAGNPPVNWGRAVTPERLAWLVSGQMYQDQFLNIPLQEIWGRLADSARMLLDQFGPIGLVLGAAGMIFFLRKSPLRPITLWAFIAFLIFSILFGTSDSYQYLLPAFLAFAVWIGFGAGGLLDLIRQDSPLLAGLAFIGILVFFGWMGFIHRPLVDASKDRRAEEFGRQTLAAAPEGALILAEGDRAVFTLWYFHFALHQRPDLFIVASDLLEYDWYQETLVSTYPELNIPGPPLLPDGLIEANPSLPVCVANNEQEPPLSCAPRGHGEGDYPGSGKAGTALSLNGGFP